MFANIYQKETRYHLKLQEMKCRKKVSSVIKRLRRNWENYSTLEDYITKKSIKSKSREYPGKIIVLKDRCVQNDTEVQSHI